METKTKTDLPPSPEAPAPQPAATEARMTPEIARLEAAEYVKLAHKDELPAVLAFGRALIEEVDARWKRRE